MQLLELLAGGLEGDLVRVTLRREPRHLCVEPRVRLGGLRRRHERSRIELAVVAPGLLKPDPELARHPKLLERGLMGTRPLVRRVVPRHAQPVEDRAGLSVQRAAVVEPVHERELRLLHCVQQPDLGRRQLRQPLAEHPEHRQRRHRLEHEQRLGPRPEKRELRIVVREVREVR